ncbi:MAG: LysR family transcriptional regulator [Ascidiaceihabitans sp.]|nr:LysR family transcriptional regulator [Ascidiaceihabitans sp.]
MSQNLPSLDLILSFRAVMDTGSLTGAAKLLALSQPTVRRQIEMLEQQIDAPLFTRATNGLTPNDMAHALLPIATTIAAQGAAFKRAASSAAQDTSGTVRVTCSRVIATQVVPFILPALQTRHPDLRIELVASNDTQDLLRRDADIAIRMTLPTQKALIQKALPDVRLGLFASPAHTATPQTTDDIAHAPFVLDDTSDRIAKGLIAAGLPEPRNTVLRCDDEVAQITALLAGVGTGFCQLGIAQRLGLTQVLPHIETTLPCFVLMHEDQRQIARIRAVFDHMCTHLPAQIAPN